jgi:Fur family peroxide stress response transcriptional regulator
VVINRSNSEERKASEVNRWCKEFERLCRARGVRVTPQRLALYRALAEDLTHPTADSVYRRISRQFPGLSQATVYRTLELLEREKLIRRVSAPEAVARFDANQAAHQHLICRVCGNMTDVSLPEYNTLNLPTVSDFIIEEMDIKLVGRCRACSKSRSVQATSSIKRKGRRPTWLNSKGRRPTRT